MNYQKIYNQLIEKRQQNILTKNKNDPNWIYNERHHIIPKCLGGTDDKSNLVNLTAREHFIAHYLLWKIYPCDGTLLAFYMFKKGNNDSCVKRNFKNSKLYESARLAYHEWNVRVHTGKKQSPEQIANRVKKNTGKKRTEETKKLMSKHCWCKGKKLSNEIKTKISLRTKEAMQKIDPERKKLMAQKNSMAHKGKKLSNETKNKMSKSRIGLHWWNNGVISIQRKEYPGEGWFKGPIKKNKYV